MGTDPWYGKAGLPDTAKLLNQDILMGEPFILGNYGLVIWNYVFFVFVFLYMCMCVCLYESYMIVI